MSKLVILQGLPGSGKSTYAREFVTGKKDWVIVNRDSLRNMRGDYWVPEQEPLITQWEDFCVKAALEKGLNVIIDATNFNYKTLNRWFTICELYSIQPEIQSFDISVEECIERDSKREKPVGKNVIMRMYNSYLNLEK